VDILEIGRDACPLRISRQTKYGNFMKGRIHEEGLDREFHRRGHR
jgi:hypothetical protein